MSPTNRFLGGVLFVWFSCTITQGQENRQPTETEIKEQIQQLDPKNEKDTRIRALRWLNTNTNKNNAAQIIPIMEKCILEDPQWEIRQQSVRCLSQIVRKLEKPCPLTIVKALHDKEDFVRYEADLSINSFKTFEEGSIDIVLKGADAENAELRSSSLWILGRFWGKDKKVLETIEKAKQDKVLEVRETAHEAMFLAKGKLAEHIPYLIRIQEDPSSFLSPGPEDSEQGKQERSFRNMILLGNAGRFIEWSHTRTDELAEVLFKLLENKSPIVRRGAANLIYDTAIHVDPPKRKDNPLDFIKEPDGSSFESLLPYLDPEAKAKPKKKEDPKKSKVLLQLEKQKVKAVLEKLRDEDPDKSVQTAARLALERISSLNEKKGK
jgi:hypothetical protein